MLKKKKMRALFAAVFFVAAAVAVAAPPVEVVLLSESLCPNCQEFVCTDLAPALAAEGVFGVVDLKLLPWGNAYFETTECPSATPGKYDVNVRVCWNRVCAAENPPSDCYGNFSRQTCQHGANECSGNRIESCAIGLFAKADPAAAWKFTVCFVSDNRGQLSAAEPCATKAGLDWKAIASCAESGSPVGDGFELANARATNALGAHQGVPWAFVAGVHVEQGMLRAICNAYSGSPKPAGCSK